MNITDLADDILGLIELEVKKKRRQQMIKKELYEFMKPQLCPTEMQKRSLSLLIHCGLLDFDLNAKNQETYLDDDGNCYREG